MKGPSKVIDLDDESQLESILNNNNKKNDQNNGNESDGVEIVKVQNAVIDVDTLIESPTTTTINSNQFEIIPVISKNQPKRKRNQNNDNNNNDINVVTHKSPSKKKSKIENNTVILSNNIEQTQTQQPDHQILQQPQQPIQPLNPLVQIQLTKQELTNRLNAFLDHQQTLHNESNQKEFVEKGAEENCARTATTLIDRSKQIKVRVITDQVGPSAPPSEPQQPFVSGAEQRITDIERYLSITNPVKPLPLDLYERIKSVENRLLEMENQQKIQFQQLQNQSQNPIQNQLQDQSQQSDSPKKGKGRISQNPEFMTSEQIDKRIEALKNNLLSKSQSPTKLLQQPQQSQPQSQSQAQSILPLQQQIPQQQRQQAQTILLSSDEEEKDEDLEFDESSD